MAELAELRGEIKALRKQLATKQAENPGDERKGQRSIESKAECSSAAKGCPDIHKWCQDNPHLVCDSRPQTPEDGEKIPYSTKGATTLHGLYCMPLLAGGVLLLASAAIGGCNLDRGKHYPCVILVGVIFTLISGAATGLFLILLAMAKTVEIPAGYCRFRKSGLVRSSGFHFEHRFPTVMDEDFALTWTEKNQAPHKMVDFPLVPVPFNPVPFEAHTHDDQAVSVTGEVWWRIDLASIRPVEHWTFLYAVDPAAVRALLAANPMNCMATTYKRALKKAVGKRRAAELVPEIYKAIASHVRSKLGQTLNVPGFTISRVVIEKIEPAASAERATRE